MARSISLGDSDALSVGDYHLSTMIGWTLLGRPIDGDEMVDLLEPLRPHRYRVVRLLVRELVERAPTCLRRR